MKKSTSTLVLLAVLMAGIQPLFANYAFYRTVINTCKAYRVDVKESAMSFITGDGAPVRFKMNLTSMRNNFDMVLLVGFISAGEAVKQQQRLAEKIQQSGRSFDAEVPSTVDISVIVPMTQDKMVIMASAPIDLVMQLADGRINSGDFMRQIKDSIQTL